MFAKNEHQFAKNEQAATEAPRTRATPRPARVAHPLQYLAPALSRAGTIARHTHEAAGQLPGQNHTVIANTYREEERKP